MTDLKFFLLDKLYSASPLCPLHKTDLLNSGFATPREIEDAIDDLFELHYIKTPIGSSAIVIDKGGRNAYESEKEKRYENACNKRQNRFNNKIAIASVLMSPIMFLVGLIVEHRSQLIDLVLSLFR